MVCYCESTSIVDLQANDVTICEQEENLKLTAMEQ